jgi:hypothetical protein
VGEPGRGVQAVQPPQGRQDPRRGAPAPDPPPFEPRSDVYSLFTPYLRTSATRPGGTTCSSAGTDRGDGRGPIAARRPAPAVPGDPRDDSGPRPRRRLRRRRLAARHAPRPDPLTGTWRPTPAGGGPGDVPGGVYENRFGTVGVRREGAGRRDHDVPVRPRLRRLPAAASGRVRRRRSRRTWPAATSRSTRSRGAAGPATPTPCRPVRRPADLERGRRLRAVGSATRTEVREDALRMIRAVRLAATLDLTIEPATLAAIAAAAGRPGPAHLSGERIAASWRSCWPRTGRRSACASEATGLLRGPRPSSRPSAASPRTRSPARTSGITPSAPSTRRRRRAGRAAGRPPPRHRQAGDLRRRPLHRPRRGRRGAGRRAPGPAALPRAVSNGSACSSATTCSATSRAGATRPSGADRADRRACPGRAARPPPADNLGSGLPADAGPSGRAPGADPGADPGRAVLDRIGPAIDGSDLIDRARACRRRSDPGLASSTGWSRS